MMLNKNAAGMLRINGRLNRYVDRGLGGFALIVLHEAGSLRGHWIDLGVRFAVARRARGIGELLRDQLDLWPESRKRFRHDLQVRRQLWRGLARDLSGGASQPA